MEISALQWPDDINCAVTVCDINGVIKYMNRRAKDTFAAHGDLIGKNLFECHSEESRAKIRHMLATGDSNAYTISKNGQRKVIYQTGINATLYPVEGNPYSCRPGKHLL